VSAVIARSNCDEAIQLFLAALDCFASLAMTVLERPALSVVIVRLVRNCALGRTIQYSEVSVMEAIARGVLDPPGQAGG
jgi:hypothetical protein